LLIRPDLINPLYLCRMPVYALEEEYLIFPDPEDSNEDGLLAVGGKLSPDWLIKAYESGIFPWFNQGDPILWWSVDPRSVLFPGGLHIQKSMRPYLNSDKYEFRMDHAFSEVVRNCAEVPGRGTGRTWITQEMMKAYENLHELGFAHSAEIYEEGVLIGGLYGVSLGRAFFGESMFGKKKNISKLVFICFARYLFDLKFQFIDCQVHTDHLGKLGAIEITRSEYLRQLDAALAHKTLVGKWKV